MVRVTEELLALSPEHVTLYRTTDSLLGQLPIFIFHGQSTYGNATFNTSRVQVHIYSPAGFHFFPRLTLSPNSPYYNVVSLLPRELQGDEIYRGIAFGLSKYFHELSDSVKVYLQQQYPAKNRRPSSSIALFSEQHVADIAKSVVRAENTADVIQQLQLALQTQHISHVDIDLVLPPGSIVPLQPEELEEVPEEEDDILDPSLRQYGMYTPLIRLFGEPIFLPTSRLKRAPSKPSSLNRAKSFSKDQKAELRRNMAELVDTEERYVAKVSELVTNVAADYRKKAKNRQPGSFSPSEQDVEKLFPKSSEQILQINTGFMRDLRQVMDDTEGDATKDLESGTASSRVGGVQGKSKDASGAGAMAKVLLEWFPKFTECYQDYIRASQNFPQLVTQFVNQQSSFSQRVAVTGEQHLRSLVIEPVQRLPRYSLVIDQIVSCLPMTHPALQLMLKARDIIANICSMDEPLSDKPHVNTRLRNMVEDWPADLEPRGRLITAVDFSEIAAPYQTAGPDLTSNDRAGLFLLFSDCIVVVRKVYGANMTARELLREIDKPSPAGLLTSMTNAAGGPGSYDLAFAGWHGLADVRFTESHDGRITWMTSTKEMKGADANELVTSTAVTSRCFALQESYDGKAARWTEDVVKARVEGRFSEKEREDPCWTLRSVKMPDTGFALFAAVFQEGLDQLVEGRKEPAPIRIVVDHEKGTKGSPVGHYGVEICSDIKTGGDLNKVMVITVGLHGKKSVDGVDLEDFLPTLSRRIIQLLSSQFNVSNPVLTAALVSFHTKILRGLSISHKTERSRSFLASSPVKYLASILAGNSSSENFGSSKHQRTPTGEAPTISPGQLSRNNSSRETHSLYGSAKSREGIRITADEDRMENPLSGLEQAFTGYMANLQALKGSFTARTILNRSAVDELVTNDLYNRILTSPFDVDCSEMSADVLFATFEKFVRYGWRDQMGPIITRKALDALQERTTKRLPGDFADFVRFLFNDMAPQNRRAFTALIKLLADLLDGCANDGDRGALTLAFAELLVDDGTAPNYINLLDRLVEDCDRIFDDTIPASFAAALLQAESLYESMNSTTRSLKSQSGSMTSTTSSLRRKFGFDNLLSRQNSKNDSDSRPSMWRSLSKYNRNPATGEPSSLSRGSVSRTKSSDLIGTTHATNKLRRPGSRDRPPIAGAFDDSYARPLSMLKLETIGEPDVEEHTTKAPKMKRRSSLSDLKNLMAQTTLEDEPLQPLSNMKQNSERFNSGPRLPPPSKMPMSPNLIIHSGHSSMRSPRQKENMDDPFFQPPVASPTKESPRKRHHTKTMSTSNIPTLRPAHSEGTEPTEPGLQPTTSLGRSAGKLRLQSPQKLRERLQTEKQAAEDVDMQLQSELSKITADMAKMNTSTSNTLPRSSAPPDLRKLAQSLAALEKRVPAAMLALTDRHDALHREFEGTLRATEAKVRAIDQLYKEASAENEILYEKFNAELGRLVRALKGRGREDKEELMIKMRDASEETARVKKENARLRREMASLRAVVKGATRDAGAGREGSAGDSIRETSAEA